MALETIIGHKREQVAADKEKTPFAQLSRGLKPSRRSLLDALKRPRTGFILECKKASPSRGLIRADFNPVAIAQTYAPYADAISVLADRRFFQGRQEYITAVSEAVSVPVLCKDFIIDPYQVAQARHFGADAVLLMLSVLDDDTLVRCQEQAESLGLDTLAEVHDKTELNRALNLKLPIIGVNNRNLKNLQVSLDTSRQLAPLIPRDRVAVAESGISSHREVVELGPMVDGFLVGTSLMGEDNIDLACRRLVYGTVKVCGLTTPEDARAAKEAGAAYGGLIFAPESPRRVSNPQAKKISQSSDLNWVGVFVNESMDRVVESASDLSLAAVQLHGEETAEYISDLRRRLGPTCEIWKAFRVRDRLGALHGINADRIVLDAFHPAARGGTGTTFDWSLLEGSNMSKIVLSGGLGPENAARADRLGAYALDVNSGVEAAPGRKDRVLMNQFFAALRGTGKRENEYAK